MRKLSHLCDYFLVELNQLLSSVENVLNALEVSGLQAAVVQYRESIIAGDADSAVGELARASDQYLDHAAAYSQSDSALAGNLHLAPLESPGFWFDISAAVLDETLRLSTLAEIQENLGFASRHLPKLLALSDGHGSVGTDLPVNDNAIIRVRIHDAVEKASFPDRISRLIDGVDMIYQCCADLAGESPDELEVMSVSGFNHRAFVFKGHPEVATATRRIIRALYQQASISLKEENYSVDQIAEQIPFMHAIDELFRVNALDAHAANEIREGVLAGSIMLLECGVRIHGDRHTKGANDNDVLVRHKVDQKKSDATNARSPVRQSDLASDDELEYLILDLNKKYKPDSNK